MESYTSYLGKRDERERATQRERDLVSCERIRAFGFGYWEVHTLEVLQVRHGIQGRIPLFFLIRYWFPIILPCWTRFLVILMVYLWLSHNKLALVQFCTNLVLSPNTDLPFSIFSSLLLFIVMPFTIFFFFIYVSSKFLLPAFLLE